MSVNEDVESVMMSVDDASSVLGAEGFVGGVRVRPPEEHLRVRDIQVYVWQLFVVVVVGVEGFSLYLGENGHDYATRRLRPARAAEENQIGDRALWRLGWRSRHSNRIAMLSLAFGDFSGLCAPFSAARS